MTADQFAYWLQGFAELNAAPPTEDQWNMIREHLSLVFNKVTPALGGGEWKFTDKWTGQTGIAVGPDLQTRTIC